jgi:hypothetical protein
MPWRRQQLLPVDATRASCRSSFSKRDEERQSSKSAIDWGRWSARVTNGITIKKLCGEIRMSTVIDKQKLDEHGARNRELWLQNVEMESQREPTKQLVRTSYGLLIERVLGDSLYVFITINPEALECVRAVNKESKDSICKASRRILGNEYYEARRSGESCQNAMALLLDRFLHRLTKKVLGSHRFKRRNQHLRWICIYENQGKGYVSSPVNHVHILLELPAWMDYRIFAGEFREGFSCWIYPLPEGAINDSVLNIQPGRAEGVNSHPEYVSKQLLDWESAADRVKFSAQCREILKNKNAN